MPRALEKVAFSVGEPDTDWQISCIGFREACKKVNLRARMMLSDHAVSENARKLLSDACKFEKYYNYNHLIKVKTINIEV